MTEFGLEWPVWQLKANPENLVERMAAPAGGLALVETGVDAGLLISTVAASIDDALGSSKSEAVRAWNYPGTGGDYRDLLDAFEGVREIAEKLHAATEDIFEPVKTALLPPTRLEAGVQSRGIDIIAFRRQQLRPSHSDYNMGSIWLGANKPGLKVFHDGNWITVDDMPPGFALMWRGDCAYANGDFLAGIKHYSQYRSASRRIIAMATHNRYPALSY